MLNKQKKLENLAWSRMEALLDKEMPTKERRRRFVLWYWVAASAIVLGGIAMSLHTIQHPVEQTIVSAQNSAAADDASEAVMPSGNTATSMTIDPINPSSISNNTHIHTNSSQYNNSIKKYQNNTATKLTGQNAIVNSAQNSTIIPIEKISTPNVVASDISAEDNSIMEKAMIYDGIANKNRFIEAITAPLNTLHTNEIFSNNQMTITTNIPIQSKKERVEKSKPMELFVGVGSRKVTSYFTPLIGAGLSYKPFEKWKLSTGIYYTELTDSRDSIVLSNASYGEYADELDKAINSTEIKNQNSTLINVYFVKQKSLHIPLTVSYRIAQKWHVNAGLYYDRVLWQKSVFQFKGVNPILSTAEGSVSNSIKTDFLTHQVNWMAGLSYQLKPKWGIQLSVLNNHKFNNIDNNSSATPYFQAMLTYRIIH